VSESTGAGLTIPDDDLITGEAVALELPPATLGLRVASGLIDVLVQAALLFLVSILLVVTVAGTDDALYAAAFLVAFVGVLVAAPTALETATRGRTLGKMALGLRTVRDDAGPISFRHALTRHLIGVVEIWVMSGVPALVSGLVSQRCKRLGDFAAGTYVVRDRFRLKLTPPPPMPPHLAAWAAAADVATLPNELTLAVRQFVMRASTLDPVRRDQLGRALAQQLSQYVAPPPPVGTHQEYFMAAVLAERRLRDGVRLAEQRVLRQRLHDSLRNDGRDGRAV
jgi:uncharacterized RDD family membrane protein YckC